METLSTGELRKVAEAATPLDFDTAEIKRRVGEVVECPHCQGEGSVEIQADYCNFDGTAIGVEFYGMGNAHGSAEAFTRAFNPKTAIELLDRLAALEAENAALKADADGLHFAVVLRRDKSIANDEWGDWEVDADPNEWLDPEYAERKIFFSSKPDARSKT